MRAWEGAARLRAAWGKHIWILRPRAFPRRASWPTGERRRRSLAILSHESCHKRTFENEVGGCARADSEGTRRSPKLGGGFLPPPKQGRQPSQRRARRTGEEKCRS